MLTRFWPVLVLAFVTGLLFRLGDQYGIAVLRMFGTQGIVIIGLVCAHIVRSIQREDGIRRVEESLQSMAGILKFERIGRMGALPFWMIETQGGKLLLGASDIPNSSRPGRAARSLTRQARAMLDAVQGQAETGLMGYKAALVLLRKGVHGIGHLELDEGTRVALVNPEGLPDLLSAQSA